MNYYDSDLVYFTSFLLKENGDTTQDALMANEIINYSLPGLAVRYSNYQIELPENITSIWVKAKFNFRPIKPFIFDELPELKQNIPIYTIDENTQYNASKQCVCKKEMIISRYADSNSDSQVSNMS